MTRSTHIIVSIGGGVSLPVYDTYDDLWTVGPGFVLHTSTEFYYGRAHLAVRLNDNDNGVREAPDFFALEGELGWGYPVQLPGGIELRGGAQIGAVRFRFRENAEFTGFVMDETEILAGAFIGAQIPIRGRISGTADLVWTHVFTAEPVSLTRLQIGLSVAFSSPAWLRDFLR